MWTLDFATSSQRSRRGYIFIQLPATNAGLLNMLCHSAKSQHQLPRRDRRPKIFGTRRLKPAGVSYVEVHCTGIVANNFFLPVDRRVLDRSMSYHSIEVFFKYHVIFFSCLGFFGKLNETYDLIVSTFSTTNNTYSTVKLGKTNRSFRMTIFSRSCDNPREKKFIYHLLLTSDKKS